MNPWLLLGSLGAILMVALVVRQLGLGDTRLGSAAEACRIASEQLSGFDAAEALVDSAGQAALVLSRDGRIALLKRHGAHYAARVLQRPLAAQRQDGGWRIQSGERRFGAVTLALAPEDEDKLLTMV